MEKGICENLRNLWENNRFFLATFQEKMYLCIKVYIRHKNK